MKQNLLIILFLVARNLSAQSVPQGIPPNTNTADRAISAWYRGGNNPIGPAGANNIFGTRWASDIWIMTNSTNIARFTHNQSLAVPWDAITPPSGSGDGLSILPQVPNSGSLDLFTATAGTTHIKFGGSGAISGQNGRLEHFATGTGFYMDAVNGGFFKFARIGVVTCRVGNNNFWRIGEQTDPNNLNVSALSSRFSVLFTPPTPNQFVACAGELHKCVPLLCRRSCILSSF
jgi:hypothetical protein